MNDYLQVLKNNPFVQDLMYRAFVCVMILVAIFIALALLKKLIKRFSKKYPQAGNITALLKTVMVVIIWIIGGLMILQTIGIAVTPILAAFGVGGLAVALSVQDSLSNLFAGLHILISHQIKVGDTIEIDTAPRGKVVDILWRYTVLEVSDHEQVIIPNSKVAQSIIRRIR